MSVNWNKIQGQVAKAVKSLGETNDGYPIALRRTSTQANPWDAAGAGPTYYTLRGVQDETEIRDAGGMTIGQTKRTLYVAPDALIIPTDDDQVLPGVTASDVDETSDWQAVLNVRTVAPAGVTLLYELDLED